MIDIKVARQTLHDLKVKGREKLDAIKAEDRFPNEEEETELAAIESEIEVAAKVVEKVEAQMDHERSFQAAPGAEITGGEPATDEEGNPFRSFGDQLQAIASAYNSPDTDPRLFVPDLKAAPQGLGSHQGGEGGFLVRNQFSEEIFMKAHDAAVLLGRTDQIPIGANFDGLEVPYIDEASRADGSRWGGVTVARVNEGDTVTASRPNFGKMETRLIDIMGLAYVTNRLLADSTALGAVLSQAFAEEFAFTVDNEIYRGTGAGEMLGVLNSGATVSVAAETGQLANTIVVENLVNMRARLWARSRANAIWLINQDVEPELLTMGITFGTGGAPVYVPSGGLSASPFDTILGRPVIPVEYCSTLGTVGDIALVDLSQYHTISKGGLDAQQSMHVRFINNEQTFRWVTRINGQPKWRTALTPFQGTNTQSPFVTLATRA
jgi:HK97 family phage major capsid protein